MFLEDPQIDLPYSCHAMTRSWLVHGFADQGARLYVGDTLASPSTLFHIDHHADHTHPESEARVGNLAHCAFSSAISGNVRIFGGNPLIWNYQFMSIRPSSKPCGDGQDGGTRRKAKGGSPTATLDGWKIEVGASSVRQKTTKEKPSKPGFAWPLQHL